MRSTPPEVALNRVLAGLEKELVEATDEEVGQAAADLGMNLKMKGSAAFIGLKYAIPKRFEDIFDAEMFAELRRRYAAAQSLADFRKQAAGILREQPRSTAVPRRKTRSYLPRRKKDRDDGK
jgi:hypothetical protein